MSDGDHNLATLESQGGAGGPLRASWHYDWLGRVTQANDDTTGNARRLSYDELGRVSSLQLPDNTRLHLQYNAYQEVTSASDGRQTVAFAYTPLGRLLTRTANPGTVYAQRVAFHYDAMEQLTRLDNEAGKSYHFGYNARGEVTREQGFDGLTRQYQRDVAGKVVKTQRPGGRWSEYEYEASGRISRVTHQDGSGEWYGYDAAGRLAQANNADSQVKHAYNGQG